MKQQLQVRSLPVAIGLAAMIVAAPTECAYARGRGGGGFSRGGFSREGPAAAGSFASRSGSMAGHERGLESGARPQALSLRGVCLPRLGRRCRSGRRNDWGCDRRCSRGLNGSTGFRYCSFYARPTLC